MDDIQRDRIMSMAERVIEDAQRLLMDAHSMADFIVREDIAELENSFRKLQEAAQ